MPDSEQPQRQSAQPVYRELRTALRELNPLRLDDPGDSYDASAANATRVLLNGGTEDEAADLVIETLRVEHGTFLEGRARRRITSQIRDADPRLTTMRPLSFPASLILSWPFELILWLAFGYFAWEAISSGYPWTVLAWPGLLGFLLVWDRIVRSVGAPKGRWVVNGLPPLLFAISSSAALFVVASGDAIYRRAAFASLIWVGLAVLGSLLYLRHDRNEGLSD